MHFRACSDNNAQRKRQRVQPPCKPVVHVWVWLSWPFIFLQFADGQLASRQAHACSRTLWCSRLNSARSCSETGSASSRARSAARDSCSLNSMALVCGCAPPYSRRATLNHRCRRFDRCRCFDRWDREALALAALGVQVAEECIHVVHHCCNCKRWAAREGCRWQ